MSNAEKALRRVGIEIRPTVDTFKDFDEIMLELYEHIDKLSEADLNNLAYELAGKFIARRYGNILCCITRKVGISVKSQRWLRPRDVIKLLFNKVGDNYKEWHLDRRGNFIHSQQLAKAV